MKDFIIKRLMLKKKKKVISKEKKRGGIEFEKNRREVKLVAEHESALIKVIHVY